MQKDSWEFGLLKLDLNPGNRITHPVMSIVRQGEVGRRNHLPATVQTDLPNYSILRFVPHGVVSRQADQSVREVRGKKEIIGGISPITLIRLRYHRWMYHFSPGTSETDFLPTEF